MAKRVVRKAVFAGSFDPVTNGHLHMIRAGAALFDQLIVAVGTNPEKNYAFTVEDRLAMLKAVSKGLKNVRVEQMPNVFLVDFARDQGAIWVLRGVRDDEDYRFERLMRYMNDDICPEVTTVFLMPPRELAEVSSSFVKGLVGPTGWEQVVEKYLPAEVIAVLRGKLPGSA
jgi:pantetheine-phosphate adenylyltransferase